MRSLVWIAALVVALLAGGRGLCGEQACCPPPEDCFLKGLAPVGGWHPYGGGLVHWWPRNCFPHCGGPDDYCRKPLPHVCWPLYPPYYVYVPTGCCPSTKGTCNHVHGSVPGQ
jgi:hypothetical protein